MSDVTEASRLIEGLDQVEAWFGHVPTFHDASLLAFSIDHAATCRLVLHGWLTTDQTDADGLLVTEKHAVVTFTIRNVFALSVSGYGEGTILSRLYLREESDHVLLAWDQHIGVGGEITGKAMTITLAPGHPGKEAEDQAR